MNLSRLKDDFSWRDLLVKIGITILTVVIICWMMPRDSRSYFRCEQGKPWRYSDLTAPFDFPVYKSESTMKAEKDSLLRAYEPYYNYNRDAEAVNVSNFVSDFAHGIPGVPDDYISIIANRLHRLYQAGIVNAADFARMDNDTTRTIIVVNGKEAAPIKLGEVLSTKMAYELLFQDKAMEANRPALQKCNLNEYIQANIVYDKERSESALKDLLSSVPLAMGVVQKGQKIIDRGEIVNEYTFRVLESLQRENEKRNSNESQVKLTVFGHALYVTLLIIFLTVYLSLFRHDYFEKPRSVAMLYALIIFFTAITALLVRNTIAHVYIIPYAMVPIFVRVFMDSRTAFYAHLIMIMICACMLQHPFEFLIVQIVSGLAAIYSLRELQLRSQLFKTAFLVAFVAAAMNFAYDLISMSAIEELDISSYNYLLVNGILLLFAYPLLYIIEKMFGFTSDISLIELSNTNNPLLRRMSEVAPGTFQHSIQVANLAAEIANKIGAKSQLVRTGALYHDIGKMLNPVYFTENQSGVSPHDNLSEIESASMIISHVTEGQKMAERYNLPSVIRDFISTHHGLGKTKYFYIKYKNEHPDDDVDELLFTYPGPNPFTREQAILMMADTVEATSRSLKEYSEAGIRDMVNNLIDGMVADGFFRECPITFRDIAYSKTVLIEKLKTVYHARITYPKLKAEEEEKEAVEEEVKETEQSEKISENEQ